MNKLTEKFFNSPTGVFSNAQVTAVVDGSDFSRHGLVKRAIASGDILQIRRGLYCLSPRLQRAPINTFALAQHIHGPSYISLETALSHHGWIPEAVYTCTNVCFGSARTFQTPVGTFSYQRVPQQVFYCGVERGHDTRGNVWLMASVAKALADYIYLRRPSWSTLDAAAASLRIASEDLLSVEADQLATLAGNYTNSRVRKFLAIWQEAVSS